MTKYQRYNEGASRSWRYNHWLRGWPPKPPLEKSFSHSALMCTTVYLLLCTQHTLFLWLWESLVIQKQLFFFIEMSDKSYFPLLPPIKHRIQSFIKNHAVFRNIRMEKVKMYHWWRKYVSLWTQIGTLKNCFRDEQCTHGGELPS